MFQTVIEAGADGTLIERAGADQQVAHQRRGAGQAPEPLQRARPRRTPRMAARWHNALQALAEQTPHGIPVTVSTDPRHAFIENAGVSFTAGAFSQWPEPLGLAALRDPDAVRRFADIARQEYLAVGHPGRAAPDARPGHRAAVGPPGRHLRPGPRPGHGARRGLPRGLPAGRRSGRASVACTTKHFPGGGPQQDGEDAHFPYGREQVYPGGRFARPPPAVPADHRGRDRRRSCPTTACRSASRSTGEPIEEVGFGYNRQVVTGLLREQLGYDGVVVTDWELVNDNHVGDQVLPARAWGVEHLDPHGRMELILAGRRRPVRRRGVRRRAARPGRSRAGSARSASTSRPGGCWR